MPLGKHWRHCLRRTINIRIRVLELRRGYHRSSSSDLTAKIISATFFSLYYWRFINDVTCVCRNCPRMNIQLQVLRYSFLTAPLIQMQEEIWRTLCFINISQYWVSIHTLLETKGTAASVLSGSLLGGIWPPLCLAVWVSGYRPRGSGSIPGVTTFSEK
jgi:hypothetical protein